MGKVLSIGGKVAVVDKAVLSDANGTDCCCGGPAPLQVCSTCPCFDVYAFSWTGLTLRSSSALAPTKKITHRWNFEGTIEAFGSCGAYAPPTQFTTWEYEILAYDGNAGDGFNCPVGTICTNDPGLLPELELLCVDVPGQPPARRELHLIVGWTFNSVCACTANIFFFSGGQFGVFSLSNVLFGNTPTTTAYCPDQQYLDPPWSAMVNGGPPGNFSVEVLSAGSVNIA